MKIHSNSQPTDRRHRGSAVLNALAGGVALLAAMTCQGVAAQSGPLGRQIRHGDESFQVVKASHYQPTALAEETPMTGEVQLVGCNSCGNHCGGSCGQSAGCGSCGTSCGGLCNGRSISACRASRGSAVSPFIGFGNPCGSCEPYLYASAEWLYMERDGKERFSLSPDYFPGGFDSEQAARLTIGGVSDCVHGYEVSFTGRFEWDILAGITDPGGNIRTFLVPGAPFVDADLSAFNDDVVASAQDYDAKYWSMEANRICIGWDIAKLLYGIRYIDYDEAYTYVSRNNAGEIGLLASRVESRMLGVQAGMDLLYPISRYGFTDFRSRIGGFANFAKSDFALINDGTFLSLASDDKTDLAGIIEVGGGVRYHFGQYFSVRLGAELWYLKRVASITDQFTREINFNSGRRTRVRGDFLVGGLTVGAELRY